MTSPRRAPTPDRQLAAFLDDLTRAYRMQLGLRWATKSLAAAFFIDVLLLAAMRLGPLPYNPAFLVTLPLVAAPAAIVAALVRKPEERSLVLRADSALGLRERLVTAIELRQDRQPRMFRELQLSDLLLSIGRIKARQAFPIHLGRREVMFLGLPLVALLALSAALMQQQAASGSHSQVQEVIKLEAQRVSAAADDLQSGVFEGNVSSFAGAQELRAAGATLKRESTTPQKALAALSAAERQLRSLRDQHATALQQALAQAAQGLQQGSETSRAGSQLANGDISAATQSLHDLASRLKNANAEQRASIAEALSAAAKGALQSAPSVGESLRQAANAVESGDPQAQNALERAAGEIGQAGKAAAAADRLDKAIAQLRESKMAISQAAPQAQRQNAAQSPADEASPSSAARDAQPSSRGDRAAGDQSTDGAAQGQDAQGAGEGSIDSSTDVFSPRPLGVRPEQDSSPEIDRPSVSTSDKTAETTQNEATVDYRDVFAAYRDQATTAAQDRYIPLDLKNVVRDYFSSLEPGR